MKRREFLRATTAGLASVAGVMGLEHAAWAKAPRATGKPIDGDRLAKLATQHFLPGKRTCGEAVLMAGCEALGVKTDIVPDVALGLAGGIGMQGQVCGTIAAAAMVLGIAIGLKERDYKKKKARVFKATGELYKRFEKRFGTTRCRDLSGLDLTTPEGLKALMGGVKANTCSKFVDAAARLLADALAKA